MGNMIRSFELEKRELDADERTFEPFITSCAYALHTAYHSTLQATPGQLVFGRDMMMPIQFIADWNLITKRKQARIDDSNRRENKKRIAHKYNVNDEVLLEKPGILWKVSTPRDGPYTIIHVSDNGTVKIRKGPVSHRVNIRRITPYYRKTN